MKMYRYALLILLLFMQLQAKEYFAYNCSDDYRFVAEVSTEEAWLFLPNQMVKLGKRGKGYGSKQLFFTYIGWDANLSIGKKRYQCKNDGIEARWERAKFEGVAFRAIGNEPGWSLEIYDDSKILFHTNHGKDTTLFTVEEKYSNITSTEYKLRSKENTFYVRIEGRKCFDTMLERSYESTVYLNFDGHELRGCGKALY